MNNTEISAEARQARNAYLREWRRKNPGKMQSYLTAYWNRKAQQFENTRPEDERPRLTADQYEILMPR